MELRLPTNQQLKTVYDRDLREAFPPAELKPLRSIEALLAQGRYEPWCLFDGEEIVGAAFLWLVRPGWALLDYLCVARSRRNDGLGGALLEQLVAARPDTVIFGEVEVPEEAPDPAMAQRRLGFYARHSARTAGYDTEVFGVHYKTIYWSREPVPDAQLMERHAEVYRESFPPERYARYVRIPRPKDARPQPQVPWEG